MTKLISILAVLGALSGSVCFAFQASHNNVGTLVTKSKSTTLLNMAPRFNKQSQQWVPSDPAVSVLLQLRIGALWRYVHIKWLAVRVQVMNAYWCKYWLNLLLCKSHVPLFPCKKQNKNPITNATQTEGPEAGYNIVGSLYRAGPMPAITRLTNPENYEQAVLKFMAKEKCDRVVSGLCGYIVHWAIFTYSLTEYIQYNSQTYWWWYYVQWYQL